MNEAFERFKNVVLREALKEAKVTLESDETGHSQTEYALKLVEAALSSPSGKVLDGADKLLALTKETQQLLRALNLVPVDRERLATLTGGIQSVREWIDGVRSAWDEHFPNHPLPPCTGYSDVLLEMGRLARLIGEEGEDEAPELG